MNVGSRLNLFLLCFTPLVISSCASDYGSMYAGGSTGSSLPADYSARVPQQIASQEKTIVVDPSTHAWGAYENGQLVRAGLATAGGEWCSDVNRPCRTKVGSFRIHSLGSFDCKSSLYPLPKGGAPMPYCMFFNGNQGLHGSYGVVDGNESHGCVRMQVADAEWVRFNFATIGTRVIVRPY